MRRLFAPVEPFVVALLATVLLATLLPARGVWASVAGRAADVGIVLLFFLHGARLPREAIVAGLGHARLHAAVLASTFMVFPLVGLLLSRALPGPLAAGMLFLTLLPSTVQSSVAFTAIARGNVAAAVCGASFSNLPGIVLTPALVAVLMGRTGAGIGLGSVETILGRLLLPFVAVTCFAHGSAPSSRATRRCCRSSIAGRSPSSSTPLSPPRGPRGCGAGCRAPI